MKGTTADRIGQARLFIEEQKADTNPKNPRNPLYSDEDYDEAINAIGSLLLTPGTQNMFEVKDTDQLRVKGSNTLPTVFDCPGSEAGFTVRHSVNDTPGAVTTNILGQNDQYFIEVPWIHPDGSYVANDPEYQMLFLSANPYVSFVERIAGTNNNRYKLTPPKDTSLTSMTFQWGSQTDPGLCSKEIPYSYSSPSAVLEVALPSSPVAKGNISDATWKTMTANNHWYSENENKLSVIAHAGNDWLQSDHEPSSEGSPRILSQINLPTASTYEVSQIFKLLPGWDWGGVDPFQTAKLGYGLAGGRDDNGWIVSGGSGDPDGWSARPMTRGDQIGIYSYHKNRANTSGDDFLGPVISIDVEHEFRMRVTGNTSGSADGRIEGWFDGTKFVDQNNIEWMNGAGIIDALFFCSFHGGNSADWSPAQLVSVLYRDARVIA